MGVLGGVTRWLLVGDCASHCPKQAEAPVTSTSSATVKKTEARHWPSSHRSLWLVPWACRLRMASGKSTLGAGRCFLHSSLHLWHASANALHEPNIGTSTTGPRIRIAWRRDILQVVVYYLEVRGSLLKQSCCYFMYRSAVSPYPTYMRGPADRHTFCKAVGKPVKAPNGTLFYFIR